MSPSGSADRPDPVDFDWVADPASLADVVDAIAGTDRYAIDTEFHRERTYFPALALVQLAWEDRIVLVDPTVPDLTSELTRLFSLDVEAVFHAAQQDLDVLTHAVGAVPARLFDTQLAGGFVGYGTPSLVALLSAELGITPPKGDRLTDWLRRPLTDDQCRYAAADVAYLIAVQDRLTAELGAARAALQAVHLNAHLALRDVLDAHQRHRYAELRGYATDRPAPHRHGHGGHGG